MAEIDEIKEEIGAIKTYLGFIVAFLITIGAGTAKVFIEQTSTFLVVLGLVGMVLLAVVFAFLARTMHKKIESLKEL